MIDKRVVERDTSLSQKKNKNTSRFKGETNLIHNHLGEEKKNK